MISLTSELTDRKGPHARGWLFYDADCSFCCRVAAFLSAPMRRRGLALAPLQDPRVSALLGLSQRELLRSIRFVSDGAQFAGADALLAVARELWWARPLLGIARIPGGLVFLRSAYHWMAARRHCRGLNGASLCRTIAFARQE